MPQRKPKRKRGIPATPPIDHSPRAFEAAFYNRIKQTPEEFIAAKLAAGSKVDAVQYLFAITATAIARDNHCVAGDFQKYYRQGVKQMTSVKKYRKLVRDRIPEIITKSGKTCTYEILDNENYIKMLDAKLQEELNEYQESKSLEELADLLEVMGAVVKARGFSWEELTTVRKEKRAKRGGFDKKILLVEVQETPSNSAAPPKQNDIQQVANKPDPENAGK